VTHGSDFLFWLGLIVSVGLVLFALSRGPRKGPERPDHYRTALTQLLHDDWEAALTSLRRAIEAGHTTPDTYIKLGNLLRRRGDHAAAFQIHQSLTVRQDVSAEERKALLRSLVEDYRALGRRAEALRTLESLAELGRDAGVLRELARESLHAGQLDDGVAHLREAQRLDPSLSKTDLAAFLAETAERVTQAGRPQDAKHYLQQALKEEGSCAPALLAMGDLAYAEGDHETALYYWQRLAFAAPAESPEVHEKLEKVYFELGKFGDIERVYAQILEKRPRDLQTTLAAARIALKKGESAEAEHLLRSALEIAPTSSAAFEMLANLCIDEGKLRELREVLSTHIEQHRVGGRFACEGCGHGSERQAGYCTECGRFGAFVAR
jgi:lipopolysaccharide biosynthesis regulator YciM